jgi:hypothetical protein
MKTAILLTLLQLGANGADAFYTHRDMNAYAFCEHNPVAAPFTRSTGVFVASEVGMNASILVFELRLRRRGHNKVALATALADTAGHTAGAWYSARHFKVR